MTKNNNLFRKTAGRDVSNPENGKFKEFLKKYGVSREKYLAEIESKAVTMSESIQARILGLETWHKYVEPIMEYYNMNARRGLTLLDDLIMLENDLIQRRLKQQELNPDYDPLEDKVYQQALLRKAKMMESLNKLQLDTAKLKHDMEQSAKTGKTGDIIVKIDDVFKQDN